MRVLHVLNTAELRGAQVFASDLVGALASQTIEQRIAVIHQTPPPNVGFSAATSVMGDGGPRVPGLRMDPSALRRLWVLVKGWRPHVIQVHGGEALKYAAVSTVPPARLVYRRIGSVFSGPGQSIRRCAYALLMRRADRIVAVADRLHREVVEVFKVPENKIVTIPNAVDFARLDRTIPRADARAQLGLPIDAPVILNVGALSWEKDPLGTLEVGDRVLEQRPDAILIVAGDGPLRPELEAMITRKRLDDRVIVLGSRGDIPRLLAASDALLIASRSEGMPASAIEAGGFGVAIAAYDVAGLSEVVDDHVTGLLAPQGNVARLAACVLALLGNRELRERLGAAARARCLQLFDIRRVASQYLSLYGELVG